VLELAEGTWVCRQKGNAAAWALAVDRSLGQFRSVATVWISESLGAAGSLLDEKQKGRHLRADDRSRRWLLHKPPASPLNRF